MKTAFETSPTYIGVNLLKSAVTKKRGSRPGATKYRGASIAGTGILLSAFILSLGPTLVKTQINDARKAFVTGKFDRCLRDLKHVSMIRALDSETARLKSLCEEGQTLVSTSNSTNRMPTSN
jgi:hypothetical protein